ncbi:DUF4382 domain-containing protein [Shewanella eurypsychrophilus]|uniref:DUF4382 domain-containing protein n=1 Tax=Shewanella eurypsychrophilus TaxID=2593656 RepID=A0ABX6V179_9GAMM|nr:MULTISPECIES: DUF4382 domain-containing protein [Shewanella]QFU21051.1 DUF4382 domain-containing protein [Shewanella sp. YLB-09]QPG56340.1 DUF4382 domain-containing protein [Shewanella eurypsychrophilus]
MKHTKTLLAIALTSLLAACGGSDSDNSSPETPDPTTGTFSLGVSDNPADAEVVNIAFKQVVLKNSEGSISFDVSDGGELKHVDLLTVQGAEVATLVSGESVPIGEYQMCIYMQKSETGSTDSSYVETANGIEGLTTNSNGSCGGVGAEDEDTGRLFLNKTFSIEEGSNTFVAEFNLAKGLQAPHGNKDYWTLKPTSVQLVNANEIGGISGQISPDTFADCQSAAVDLGLPDIYSQAVYLYPIDTTLADMADFRAENEPYLLTEVAPIASTRVNPILDADENEIGQGYEFGFLDAGTYGLGYTCVAQNDDPDAANTPDDEIEPFFIHVDEQAVVVELGSSTERHFPEAFVPAS